MELVRVLNHGLTLLLEGVLEKALELLCEGGCTVEAGEDSGLVWDSGDSAMDAFSEGPCGA